MVQHVTVKNGIIFHPRRKKYEVSFMCNRPLNRPLREENDINFSSIQIQTFCFDMHAEAVSFLN